MAELSGFDSLLRADSLYEIEIERAVSKHFGRPAHLPSLEVFGKGFDHAFGSLTPRVFPDLTALPQEIQLWLGERLWNLREFWILGLVPFTDDMEIPGPDSFVGFAEEFQVAEAEIAGRLKDYTKSSRERELVALIRTLQDVWQLAQDVCFRNGLTIDDWLELGVDGLKRFVEDIPTRDITYQLEAIRYQDPDLPRERGDLFDLAALSTALAYCDVVVTERTWQHIVGRTAIAEKYETLVLSRLQDLAPILRELGA
jgi:hypothetical protein